MPAKLGPATASGLDRVAINQGVKALTSASTVATDASTGNVFTLTLGVNATLANPSNMVAGASYAWKIKQDATGSRTLAYGSAFKWLGQGGAPTLQTAAGAMDVITGISFDGVTIDVALQKATA